MFEKLLNFFSENLSLIYFYFPLGVIGIWRWSVWLFKKITSLFYKLPQGNFQSTVSIVTPVYNEDPEMFQMALVSWKLNNPEEIIAVIDYTDEKCIKVFKKFSQNFSGAKLIITNIPGKRDALAKGIMEARSEIVALVDSDTIWSENLKNKLLAPFENPNVGGCAPRQDVLQATTLAKKFFRLHLFNRYGNDLIAQAAAGKALSCISGRTGFYRRRAIIDLLDDLVNEKFLGKRCISGDDKRLTHLIQSLGWQVVYVADALVYTPGFDSLWTFTKQQIRWTRNSWRADMKAIFSRWLWKNYFLAFHTIDRFFQPFSLLIGPVFLVISLIRGDWKIAIVLVLWWFFSRSIKFFSYLIRNPKDIAIIPLYTFYQYVLAVIKIYTLLTVDEQSWITRWSKNRISNSALFRKIPSYAATISIIFFNLFRFMGNW